MPTPEQKANIRAQLQTDEPTTPGASLGKIAKAWLDWRLRQKIDPEDPTTYPMSPGVIWRPSKRVTDLMYSAATKNPKIGGMLEWFHKRPEKVHIIEKPGLFTGEQRYGEIGPTPHPFDVGRPVSAQEIELALEPNMPLEEAIRTLVHEGGHGMDVLAFPPMVRQHTNWRTSNPFYPAMMDWLKKVNPNLLRRQSFPEMEAYTRFLVDKTFGGRTPGGSLEHAYTPPDITGPWR